MDNATIQPDSGTASDGSQAVQIPQNIRNLHNKALAALERNNTDIAIDLFLKCVEQCPSFSAARRNLRLTEIARFKSSNGQNSLAHHLSALTGFLPAMNVHRLMKTGKLEEALVECEKLLLKDPLNLTFVKLFAEVAIKAGHGDDGLMTLEIVREHLPPNNLAVLETMGRLYYQVKNYRKARECLDKVHRAKPGDAAITRMLKDSEALATLDAGWEDANKGGDFRGALANKDEAVKLEQESKMIKTADDAESLIQETLKKIEAEPKNINYYLSLTGLYFQQKRFAEALATVENARKLVGSDPELDRRFSNIKISQYDADIAALREAGDEATASAKETERNQYVFDDIADRVTRYPNDQHLRYELGVQYFKYEYFDEAIQQLQIAQKNPKDRVSALYHLALCFRKKGLLDMAVAQLEQALEFLPSMNPEKMDIYYLLGEISLEEEKLEDAARYFKEIYRVDVTYRDIGKYIENIYAAQKKAKKDESEK